MAKKNILILCGGCSAEHEVSILSARNILEALDKNLFTPIVVLVSQTGTWYYLSEPKDLYNIKVCMDPFKLGQLAILGRIPNQRELFIFSETTSALDKKIQKTISIDTVFPIIHGPMGEDGTLQGLLTSLKVPYVGSGVLASALGMDKVFTKKIWASEKIPVVPFLVQTKEQIKSNRDVVQNINDTIFDYASACASLQCDILFIKPAVMGSSVGVSKVRNESEYQAAMKLAFEYDSKVLIEKYIAGREVECAVLGNTDPKASVLGEIKPVQSRHEFYSYESKYLDPDGAELLIPAALDPTLTQTVRQFAVRAYQVLECKGLARVDFFITAQGEIYLNEINTLPGFTSISMYPSLWGATGIEYSDLITQLIQLAHHD